MNHIKIKSNSTQTSTKSNRNRLFYAGTMSLIGITSLSGMVLSSVIPSAFADESIVDVVTINVPVSCSMSAAGTSSHTATVNNGQTVNDIGTTNLNVICNDNSGYAIYAIGYTDDIYGKTVLTNSALTATSDIITSSTIATGTSSWAMKLVSVSGTYTPIIAGSSADDDRQVGDPDFSSYQAVPEEYTKVAYYTASTDAGTSAAGSSLSSTYRAYISPTQPAGTYVGQVKYTLVHPNGEFPFPDNLVGATLRFNEQIDVESLTSILGSAYTNADLQFTVKITPADVCDRHGIPSSGITTWSQFVDSLPAVLASIGATDIQSDMQIINKEQSFSYIDNQGFYYFDGGASDLFLYYSNIGGGSDMTRWQYLPASTGSMSFTFEGDSYSFNSLGELISAFANGAWLDEQYYGRSYWSEDFFRTISIYGGADATNPALIQWLSNNATVLYIEDSPADKEWTFNEFAQSDPAMQWDVSGSVYSNQYTAYHFDDIDTNTDYGVPIWAMFYSEATAPYEFYDGFVYISEDLSIPEYEIDYRDGWYFGNGQRLAEYIQVSPPTITLEGGDDLYNPAFISWLRENATSH